MAEESGGAPQLPQTGIAASERPSKDGKPELEAELLAELQTWDGPSQECEDRLRAALVAGAIPGPCVLDLRPEIILSYAQGDWSLIERDLACVFSGPLASRLEAFFRGEVLDCLAVRRELINYKKLCLHLWQAGSTVEKDLRQLASFFFSDLLKEDPPLERREKYSEIANSMNECHGAVLAVMDARYFGKAICNLPRHPSSGVPWKFEELPESLEVWKVLEQAKQFVRSHAAIDAYWAARWSRGAKEDASPEGAGGAEVTTKPVKQQMKWKSERHLVPSPLSRSGLDKLLADIPPVPQVVLKYVELVLIARGGAKALTVRSALRRYCKALAQVMSEVETVLMELRTLMKTTSESAAGVHLYCEKHRRVLTGVAAVIPQMLNWLEPISEFRDGAERCFVSGAKGAATFVPAGFPDLLRPYRRTVQDHRSAMIAELKLGSWPKSARPRPEEESNFHACRKCNERYTKLWLHRELCFTCEEDLRTQGQCPFNERCKREYFCPHERRCVVCEQWSCAKCRLLRGDGEDVWHLVEEVQPAVIFLDFDRTLATTKAGASPLEGNHSVDPDLAAVCSGSTGRGRVQIVTRSSRVEDIQAFLEMKGVPIDQVHSVKRKQLKGKADAILEQMALLPSLADVGIFVDDDVKELTEPRLAPLVEEGRLHRLLFVRASLDR